MVIKIEKIIKGCRRYEASYDEKNHCYYQVYNYSESTHAVTTDEIPESSGNYSCLIKKKEKIYLYAPGKKCAFYGVYFDSKKRCYIQASKENTPTNVVVLDKYPNEIGFYNGIVCKNGETLKINNGRVEFGVSNNKRIKNNNGEEKMDGFVEFLNKSREFIKRNMVVVGELDSSNDYLKYLKSVAEIIDKIDKILQKEKIEINYVKQLEDDINSFVNMLSFNNHENADFLNNSTEDHKKNLIKQLNKNIIHISNTFERIRFNFYFFNEIGFFNRNIVAVGANGSGKTTLSNKFKQYLQNNGVVISAQRVLLVPDINSLPNPQVVEKELKQYQARDKTNKNASEYAYLQNEFGVVLKNLLSEEIKVSTQYRKNRRRKPEEGESKIAPETKLDVAFDIWNSLIKDKKIDCPDGMNFVGITEEDVSYPAIKMSDGEKVILYLIGQVLLAPEKGFIVIDEPEMYLHKTILKKLWNVLEKEREDCLFIYLTHDLDFAKSRVNAKKIWIKSFKFPDKWEIESIPENKIPETLLLEILGSKNNILFCEGEKGKIDERVYSILFPNMTVIPVESCSNVINYTKSFKELGSLVNVNAYGLIDRDHGDDEWIDKQKEFGVFSFEVAEAENLFLDLEFLIIMANQFLEDVSKIQEIKSAVFDELKNNKEMQASHYIREKTVNYFKGSNIRKGNSLEEVKGNYNSFAEKVCLEDWYNERLRKIENIINNDDYQAAIKIFNNKYGLPKIVNEKLKVSHFIDKSIKLLESDESAQSIILKYFPDELKNQ